MSWSQVPCHSHGGNASLLTAMWYHFTGSNHVEILALTALKTCSDELVNVVLAVRSVG